MVVEQTYKRETARQIAERIRNQQPGTPVFTRDVKAPGKAITSLEGRRP